MEKLIALFFAFAILGQAYVARVHARSWLCPACLYGLFWFVYTGVPLVVAPSVVINPLAIIYIFFACLLFSAPAFAFNWRPVIRMNRRSRPKFDYGSRFIKRSFYLLSCAAILATMANWGFQGVSYYDIFFNLLDTSGEYMAMRYSGDLQSNVASQMSIVLTYPAAILGGVLHGSRPYGDNGLRYLILATTSATLMMLVEAAKGTFFLVLVLFWAGSLLVKVNRGDVANLVEPRTILRIAAVTPVVVGITAVSFLARGIDTDAGASDTISTLSYYFLSYSSGHLYAFADWFSSITTGGALFSYASLKDSNGFYTFMSFFKLMGSSKTVPPGVYDEYYYFGEILQTNIYTHYRGLILDFGLIGSLIGMFLAGALAHLMFYFLLRNRAPWVAASFFAHLLGYIYTSFIVSVLIWNSVFASFIILALILFVNNKCHFWFRRADQPAVEGDVK